MEYVCYCQSTVECRVLLEQFIKENHLDMSCARLGLIPYRVDLPDTQVVWFVPKCLYKQWSRGRQIQVIYGTPEE